MEVEVIKIYSDKDTKQIAKVGDLLKYSDKRAKFLIKEGYVKEVKKSFEDSIELNKK